MGTMFQRTIETFAELMGRELGDAAPVRSDMLDEAIATLETRRPGSVREVVRRAVSSVNPNGVPLGAEGDFIFNFFGFLASHNRTPKKRPWVNDVLFDLKTSDKLLDPLRVLVTDKELVKLYIRATIGDDYNIPTERIIAKPSDLEKDDLPLDCVLKPTHLSGRVIVRRAGSPVDLETLRSWLRLNYYHASRERNYRHLAPKIIVEPIILDGEDLVDYKFFCVDGKVRAFFAQQNTLSRERKRRQFYDQGGVPLPYQWGYPRPDRVPVLPNNLRHMIDVAEKLGNRFDFVRVDLYSDGSQCLVGEITHCHGGANQPLEPRSDEEDFSRLLFANSSSRSLS